MTVLLVGFSSFIAAFFICLQSINIVRGHKIRAAFTSAAIGLSQLVLLRLVPKDPDIWVGVVFILAGVVGSQLSMYVKPPKK